jgi:hypothetical protein
MGVTREKFLARASASEKITLATTSRFSGRRIRNSGNNSPQCEHNRKHSVTAGKLHDSGVTYRLKAETRIQLPARALYESGATDEEES